MRGKSNQRTMMTPPTTMIKTSPATPITIRHALQAAPIILEKKLETRVAKYSPILKPLG